MIADTPFGKARYLYGAMITKSGRIILTRHDWQIYIKAFHEMWGYKS